VYGEFIFGVESNIQK